MAIRLEMVLWVLCMNHVGLSITSPSSSSWRNRASLFSQQPKDVAVMMASGFSIPASRKALSEASSELFNNLPMRRASSGLTNSRIPNSSSSEVILTLERILADKPEIPDRPDRPEIPEIPEIPDRPDRPEIPGIPGSPDVRGSRLNTSEESFPPKPKALQRTWRRGILSAPIVGMIPAGIGNCHPRLAGTKWCCRARIQMTASILPEALVV